MTIPKKRAPRANARATRQDLAAALTYRYAQRRHDAAGTFDVGAGIDRALRDLVEIAVPEFSDWCAVDLIEGDATRSVVVKSATCRHEGVEHDTCCASDFDDAFGSRSSLIGAALAAAPTQYEGDGVDGRARLVAVALRVNGDRVGVVTFARSDEGFSALDISAAEVVTWSAAQALEQATTARTSREAVRQTQRIASQLHQLIAVSFTVTGLSEEVDILKSLAASTRSVFGAGVAVVSLDLVRAIAVRGERVVSEVIAADDTVGYPGVRAGSRDPWVDRDWLVAPIFQKRGRVRGVVAIRRESGLDYADEDHEVIALLAQMASTALSAATLNRTIQASESRLRVLIETAPVGIIEVDFEGRVRWWNRAASRVFAWNEFTESASGADVAFPLSTAGGFSELWREARQGTHLASRDFVDVDIAGRLRVVTASAALLPPVSGELQGLLTLVNDVTDQRELQSEMRHAHTMETRGQVASKIAHDFNNLLTLISGYAELLEQDLGKNDKAARLVGDIQATTSRASLLTTQLQSIGRTKATERMVFSPVAVVQSNAEVLERILGPTIELTLALDEGTGNLFVDPDQFEQMLLNLTLNARDAMPDGGQLTVRVEPVALSGAPAFTVGLPDGHYVRLSVEDTGLGMDDETLAKCFEPLFTTKGPFNGTGLGLAAARRFVGGSEGSIRATSVVGRGSTFEVLLPRSERTIDGAPHVEAPSRTRGSATILLAEDDEGQRRLMTQVLLRNGYHVVEAASGEVALESAASMEKLDLLVSDVLMGELSGDRLAAALQEARAGLRVLLVSGTEDASVTEGLARGTSAFLAKPFKPSHLIDVVDELLSRRLER